MSVVELERQDDGVGVITLNRPAKKNALSMEVLRALTTALGDWQFDDEVRALVVTGAEGTFSAGFDLTEMTNPQLTAEIKSVSTVYHRALYHFPKPTFAAISGYALAGGLDLATLCDVRIAGPDAVFGHPEIRFGGPPLFTPLRWLVGHGHARELCLTGRQIDAAEAARIGLVNRVVEHPFEEALAEAAEVAALPPDGVAAAKRYLTQNPGRGFDESFRIEHDEVFENQIRRLDQPDPRP